MGVPADRVGRYPSHLEPLKQLVDTIDSVVHAKLPRQQLSDISSAHVAAATAMLQLLDGVAKCFFLCHGKPPGAAVMRYTRQAIAPFIDKPF
jgi:hypothetical protein